MSFLRSGLIALLLWVSVPSGVWAQSGEDSLFARGLEQLKSEQWSAAGETFQRLLGQFPHSHNTDIYQFNLGKAAYHAHEFGQARQTFDAFLAAYPKSPYVPYAVYFWANSALATAHATEAVPEYIRAFALTTDARLQRLIVDGLSAVDPSTLHQHLTHESISRLSPDQRCALVKTLAEQLLAQQRIDDAEYYQTLCDKPSSAPPQHADSLGHLIRIGVVVPLSGEYEQYGEEIWHGASIAAQQITSGAGHQVELSPFDTQGDPIAAGRIVRELARMKYDAIIGPLTSAEASVAAAAVSSYDIPIIIPAATGAGLTLLSPTAYQLCPNIELQGVQLAEYAYRNLRADSAVIITPTEMEHLQIAQAFASRFEALGGKVIGVEYYRSSDRDFGQYIMSVKSLIQHGVSDSAVYLGTHGDTLNAKALPARVDCIFMPGSSDQIKLLVSQLRFYNLTATYLGSDGWGSDQIYALGDDVCRGALFTSPFLQRGTEQKEFIKAYMALHGEGPTRLACLGYDAASLLLTALGSNAATRQEWMDRLAHTTDFDGAAGRITFGRYRENVELPMYRIEAGRPVLVGVSIDTSAGDQPAQ